MTLESLINELRASLNDAASVFIVEPAQGQDPDYSAFKRHLRMAALDFGRVRPRRRQAELELTAGESTYPVEEDFLRFGHSRWGVNKVKPWEDRYAGKAPQVNTIYADAGLALELLPAPTGKQIDVYGSTYPYTYYAGHAIGETASDTTILPGNRGLLILRAQAEAMKELAMRGSKKPVQLREGLASAAKNSTPAALYDQLMRAFNAQAMF